MRSRENDPKAQGRLEPSFVQPRQNFANPSDVGTIRELQVKVVQIYVLWLLKVSRQCSALGT